MRLFVVLAVLVFAAFASSLHRVRRGYGDQQPQVWDALDVLRGKAPLDTDTIQNIVANAVPGQDYPLHSRVPDNKLDCVVFDQPGFYADTVKGDCQVFFRCDVNGVLTGYICPNMTLFNQITLVCDWFYNVDCNQSRQFENYSNSRLYQENKVLLDTQDVYEVKAATGAALTGSSTQGVSNSNVIRSSTESVNEKNSENK